MSRDRRHRSTPRESRAANGTGGVRPSLLWFVFLGGAAVWFIQHAFGYAITEVGCHSSGLEFMILGIDAPSFLTGLVTLVAAGVAAVAGLVAFRIEPRRLTGARVEEVGAPERHGRTRFMAYTGFLLNILFLVAILSTGAAFLFLRPC